MKYKQLREIVDPWSKLGSRQYLNGTLRIGHIPHLAPEGYLHRLLPPISRDDLEALQNDVGISFPVSLRDLLSLHNGLSLFDLKIVIDGRRTSYRRSDIDAMMEQPYDMVLPNTLGRPDSEPDKLIFNHSHVLSTRLPILAVGKNGELIQSEGLGFAEAAAQVRFRPAWMGFPPCPTPEPTKFVPPAPAPVHWPKRPGCHK